MARWLLALGRDPCLGCDHAHRPERDHAGRLEHMFVQSSVDTQVGGGLATDVAAHRSRTWTDERVVVLVDRAHAGVCAAQLELIGLLGEVERRGLWERDGARDLAHWVSMRYGISMWKAHRWVAAARILPELPLLSAAFAHGEIGLDAVVELCRFATAETESSLIGWAHRVTVAAVRHRADVETRRCKEEVEQVERDRSLTWWYTDEGRRLGLEAELPAAQGSIVVRAIERMASVVPAMPGEQDRVHADVRRADALVAVCSARLASDPDPDRATVVVHAPLQALIGPAARAPAATVEGGPVVGAETLRRLACNARIQTVVEDAEGTPLALGRTTRRPSAAMLRLIRHRDRGCIFPGCGTRAFTEAHHVRWWRHGGRTDVDNLALVCSFHHRLVHEHGWSMCRGSDGTFGWLRPDGMRHTAGPGPPAEAVA